MKNLELPEIRLVSGGCRAVHGTVTVNGTPYRTTNYVDCHGPGWVFGHDDWDTSDDRDDYGDRDYDDRSEPDETRFEDPDCPTQMVVAGAQLETSIRGVDATVGVGQEVAGANSDGDTWLMISAGAGFDLRELSGLQVLSLLGVPNGGASGFVMTMPTDEAGGDVQTSITGSFMGAQLAYNPGDDCDPISAGAQIGDGQFTGSVTGNVALNLSDMATDLNTSIEDMLRNWQNSIDSLQNTNSDDTVDNVRDLFTPPGVGDYDELTPPNPWEEDYQPW